MEMEVESEEVQQSGISSLFFSEGSGWSQMGKRRRVGSVSEPRRWLKDLPRVPVGQSRQAEVSGSLRFG
jgi:hypothetical protein